MTSKFYQGSGFYGLADEVVGSIRDTMVEAFKSGKHELGSWIKEGDAHHIKHAYDHLTEVDDGWDVTWIEVKDVDLEHALCRLAMALYCRKKGVIGDFGPDGKNRPA